MTDDGTQKLRALENVLTQVVHDLRTPLSVVQTTTALLLNPKYQLTPEQAREQHERIRRNADLMSRLIGHLTDMVHLRSGPLPISPEPLSLNDLLREAVAAHDAQARDKGLSLRFDADAEVTPAAGDRTRLTQLFQILLGNALQRARRDDRIEVTSRVQGAQARIDIADFGPGIAPDALPHVFDPETGSGLGLYIAKAIVDAHGGTLDCSSTPDAGTTFRVTLPLQH